MKAFQETAEQTVLRLGTDTETGLSDAMAAENAKKYGTNSFTGKKPKSLASRVLHAANEPMIVLLIVSAVITLIVNIVHYFTDGATDFVEVIAIFAAISLAVAITVVMEGKSQKAFDALNKIKEDIKVKVMRNGRVSVIGQQDLVVGDIALFETGDKIPADGRLIEAAGLSVDESSLTGESAAVKKNSRAVFDDEKTAVADRINMLYSGCYVSAGRGKMIVTEVGDNTEFGHIAGELAGTEKGSTPLQEKLEKMGRTIAILGSSVAGLVFLVQLAGQMIGGTLSLNSVLDDFIASIVLIVATVPEGLPTIVAVSLAINIIKMAKQNALVKKLIACETIGSINIICSDKTGTLTENKMTVTDIYTNGNFYKPEQLAEGFLTDNFCINSTAHIEVEGNREKYIGSATESAILAAYLKSVSDKTSYIKRRENAGIEYTYTFSSETKNMTTVVRRGSSFLAFSKGSPEKIMAQCSKIITDGRVPDLTKEIADDIEEKIAGFQKNASRVLAFAHKEFTEKADYDTGRGSVESDMVYDGFAVITDPLRHDVREAADRCKSAGIGLKILTGDNVVTARAIADRLGLLKEGSLVAEAREIEDLPDGEFIRKLSDIKVVARSTPSVKMRVVNALKSAGYVVAVTGDGINDAPALKNADVGIAMGVTGTEVSKEASDIVLLDDSFSTIVTAVRWGRGIYENFQRFIQFQLTVNLSSVLVILVSVLTGLRSPFTALQILWVNIVMDGPPALTLGLEPVRDDIMDRPPIPRNAGIITGGMLSRIVFNGVFISSVFLLQTYFNILGGTKEQQPAILFTLFVVFQLMNAFNSRELSDRSLLKHLSKNKLMLLVFGITFLLQVVITQFGGAVYNTVPLPAGMWLKIIAAGSSVIAVAELFKLVKRLLHK